MQTALFAFYSGGMFVKACKRWEDMAAANKTWANLTEQMALVNRQNQLLIEQNSMLIKTIAQLTNTKQHNQVSQNKKKGKVGWDPAG